jgi:hypothetical protein
MHVVSLQLFYSYQAQLCALPQEGLMLALSLSLLAESHLKTN